VKSVVAIVGRPNVGKSTLFNRLIGESRSITDKTPGVTRDRIYGEVQWTDCEFIAVDTGGLEDEKMPESLPDRQMARSIRSQVESALEAADAVIFVVDGREGMTSLDQMIADMLRRRGIPVILAANKIDSHTLKMGVSEFYQLGIGDPIPIAAEHGRNTGDLLDAVVAALPQEEESEEHEDDGSIRVAVVGRPNVGKSSLLNKLLDDERVLVSEKPGTTRDAVEVSWKWDDQFFKFVDTAGLRKRSRIDEQLEWYSVSRALRAVRKSDIVLLMLDATEMVTEQDQKIASYTKRQGRAAVILVNKWDLVDTEEYSWEQYMAEIYRSLYFVDYARAISISALTGQRLPRIPEQIISAHKHWQKQVRTSDLNRIVRDVIYQHEPPAQKGRKLRIYYGTQVSSRPPTFLFFVNHLELITNNYKRYLERALRRELELEGTPVRLLFRKSE